MIKEINHLDNVQCRYMKKYKSIVVILIFHFGFAAYSQGDMPQIDSINPMLSIPFFSEGDTITLKIGDSTIFTKSCSGQSSGDFDYFSIGFKKSEIGGNNYEKIIFIKDTVVVKSIHYFAGDDLSTAFRLFGLDKAGFSEINENTFHYSIRNGNALVNCWYNKNSFYYEEKIDE